MADFGIADWLVCKYVISARNCFRVQGLNKIGNLKIGGFKFQVRPL